MITGTEKGDIAIGFKDLRIGQVAGGFKGEVGNISVTTTAGDILFGHVNAHGEPAPGPIVKLEPSRPLMGPDGMRSVGGKTMLLVEGAGRLDEVTIDGILGNNVASSAITYSIGALNTSTTFSGNIVDSVGGETLQKSLHCLAYRGRVITVGDAGRAHPHRPRRSGRSGACLSAWRRDDGTLRITQT